ncbi:MAG TPA: sugar phosphate nucleotidyltransferase [Gemmatimonadales bacterium]
MKVVLFCGGLGMRLRGSPDNVPKPMVPIGGRPILWHLMKYYAHSGITDFVLCLGYGGEVIRDFLHQHEEGWSVAFVDSGIEASIGQRLLAAEPLLAGEEVFCANYADGLTDLPFSDQLAHFLRHDRVAGLLSVRPNLSYHAVSAEPGGVVTGFHGIVDTHLRVNGGFFIFKRDIFRYIRAGEELVEEPFQRLIRDRQLVAYEYDGFWLAVDTAKDKQRVDELYARGAPPWMVWEPRPLVIGRP